MKIQKRYIVLLILILTLTGLIAGLTPLRRANAAAPGCPANRPTAIKGIVYGYGGSYNNWTVNVQVGMDLLTSTGTKVSTSGTAIGGGYSYNDFVNPTLAQPGAASGLDRSFGASLPDGNGILCVASNIRQAWFELYPKNTSGVTTKTYYGGANYQKLPVNPGATNSYTLRIPTNHTYGGNTGDVNGFVRYQGHGVSTTKLQFRVFPTSPGTSCGVHGFAASADYTDNATSSGAYYQINGLAGGQCNAKYQQYKVIAVCISGGCGGTGSKSITALVNIYDGQRPRIDFNF